MRVSHSSSQRSPYEFHGAMGSRATPTTTHNPTGFRRHSLTPSAASTISSSATSAGALAAAMSTWKISASHSPSYVNHHEDVATTTSYHTSNQAPVSNPQQQSQGMKFLLRQGQSQGRKNSGQSPYPHPNGVLKVVPPTTGFHLQNGSNQPPVHTLVQLPEGTLHVWIYQARHLVFRRLFETMYERHGLRLRVYASSRSTQDVGEIYETRRNYGGNMANPRWRRDQDDARDNTHGHFSIPLTRGSLRSETELTVEIVCGILVVAHTKISLPSLFLGSFGTDLESLATRNMQFRPHWFPLAGDDSGLIEMSLEFIPTKIVQDQPHVQQQQQQQYEPSNQPESEFDDYDDDLYTQDESPYLHDHAPPRSATPEKVWEAERDFQRAREYEVLERQEQLRRQRFELLDEQERVYSSNDHHRARSATTASSNSTSSSVQSANRFVLPRRSSLSDIETRSYGQEYRDDEDDLAIMDVYESSPPPSEFSGYEHHDDGRTDGGEDDHDIGDHDDDYEGRSSLNSDYYSDLSMSASSSWASVSSLNDSSANQEENLLNKQLWDLYRYGISDESPEEVTAYSVSPRSSMISVSSSVLSRKMSTMSQASNYSVAFSDASEASMLSREASTCASEILTYNDRIQRMEEAIRAAQDRRLAEEATATATSAIQSQALAHAQAQAKAHAQAQAEAAQAKRKASIPPAISTNLEPVSQPIRQPPHTPYGWERIPLQSNPLPSPAASEPVMLDNRKGVVLFDLDDIPVKGQSGQTDPALAAYRAKMLARRRSLPIHMLSGAPPQGARDGFPPPLMRELSAPQGRLLRMGSQPRPMATVRGVPTPSPPPVPKIDSNQWGNHLTEKRVSPKQPTVVVQPRPSIVDSPSPPHPPRRRTSDAHEDAGRRSEARSSKSDESINPVPGPPSLRRKRSSSLHSISDLLRDQSFRIHNIATGPPPPSVSSSRHSMAERRPSSVGDRKLSHASSSDASSNGTQVVPTVTASSAVPRVRRNSKGGGNIVQINGVALGVGKFINVGNVPGVIRYIGPTMFAPGQWIGIELVEKKGKHNGTVQNVQYFECAPEHGIFIRAERLDISS